MRRLAGLFQPQQLDASLIPPYLAGMRRRTIANYPSALRALLVSLLVVCLFAAPLCSARCSAEACALRSSKTAATSCHESAGADQNGWKATATTAKCRNSEILFTETRLDKLLTFSRYLSAIRPALSAPAFPFVSTNADHISEDAGHLVAPHPVPLPSVPLRI